MAFSIRSHSMTISPSKVSTCHSSSSHIASAAAAAAAARLRPSRSPLPLLRRAPQSLVVAAANAADAAAQKEAELEDKVEQFMRAQAEKESGAAFARTAAPAGPIGADLIPDEEARAYARGVVEMLKLLKATRDMSPNEAALVVAIEDPSAREARKMGIEDERGVSRDEMAAALADVAAGRLPADRLALKCLHDELRAWPDIAAASAAGGGGGGGGDYSSGVRAQ